MVMSRNRAILFTALTTAILLSSVLLITNYGNTDSNIAGEAFKSFSKVPSSSSPSSYTWELDTSYVNKLQGGRLAITSQQGGAYYDTDSIKCPNGQVIIHMRANSDMYDLTEIDGMKIYCAEPVAAQHSLSNWGYPSDQLVAAKYSTSRGWGDTNLPGTPWSANYISDIGYRKLQSYTTQPWVKFVTKLRAQELTFTSNPTSASVSPQYNWIDLTSVLTPLPTDIDTVNCRSSNSDTAYLISGLKIYSTKRTAHSPPAIQGMKIFCTKFNRVAR